MHYTPFEKDIDGWYFLIQQAMDGLAKEFCMADFLKAFLVYLDD